LAAFSFKKKQPSYSLIFLQNFFRFLHKFMIAILYQL